MTLLDVLDTRLFSGGVHILGSHARKGLEKAVSGSVGERVMRPSPAPLLLVG